jgi:hypothetical protein
LELLAAFLTLQALCSKDNSIHILLEIDNTTAVVYINKMGGTKEPCNTITRDIWQWGIKNHIWLQETLNTEEDKESRKQHDNTEWQLNPNIFERLIKVYPVPKIDLFASRINYQVKPFISWKPDSEAHPCDAFTLRWQQTCMFYAFAPFSLIAKALVKIENDQAEGILIAPW